MDSITATATLPTKCALCPRVCGANRAGGERGYCGADDSLVVARAALHEWEEPPISVGKGSGTVFFSHCPLRCIYCQNAPIAHKGEGVRISVDNLAQVFLDLQEQGAANINLVTPTHYAVQIVRALHKARKAGLGLPVAYNTSGYERAEVVRSLVEHIDIFLTDFKYADQSVSDAAARYSRAPGYFDAALPALEAMAEGVGRPLFDTWKGEQRLVRGVVVRHLLLPGRLDDAKQVISLVWDRLGDTVLYSLMSQYTPLRTFPQAAELNRRTSSYDYEALLDYCDALGMHDYFWQEGEAAQESFIPLFDRTGLERFSHT